MRATTRARKHAKPREPLSFERALRAALSLADAEGIEAVSMRRLAKELGVEAMSLYHHVASKDAVVDAMVDAVFNEIALPPTDVEWREAMRTRAAAVRQVLSQHRWAAGLLESRANPGPATLAHHDAMIGCFRRAGFSLALTGHAYSLIDAYTFGFVRTELHLPIGEGAQTQDLAQEIFAKMPKEQYPHFVEFTVGHVLAPGYLFAREFDFGLELILDGLERARQKERINRSP